MMPCGPRPNAPKWHHPNLGPNVTYLQTLHALVQILSKIRGTQGQHRHRQELLVSENKPPGEANRCKGSRVIVVAHWV
jgi:hypothetical protein